MSSTLSLTSSIIEYEGLNAVLIVDPSTVSFSNFLRFKQSHGVAEEIKKTVEYILNKIMKKRIHIEDINSVLNPKTQAPVMQKTNQIQKTTQKT